MRHRLAKGEESSRYRPGQFVKASYAERYIHKVVEVVPREEIPLPEEPPEVEGLDWWEITVEYEG